MSSRKRRPPDSPGTTLHLVLASHCGLNSVRYSVISDTRALYFSVWDVSVTVFISYTVLRPACNLHRKAVCRVMVSRRCSRWMDSVRRTALPPPGRSLIFTGPATCSCPGRALKSLSACCTPPDFPKICDDDPPSRTAPCRISSTVAAPVPVSVSAAPPLSRLRMPFVAQSIAATPALSPTEKSPPMAMFAPRSLSIPEPSVPGPGTSSYVPTWTELPFASVPKMAPADSFPCTVIPAPGFCSVSRNAPRSDMSCKSGCCPPP